MRLPITRIQNSITEEFQIELDLLRLDLFHPVISGNKYFKLQHNLSKAIEEQCEGILSFGGAYSNHLHALAYAANEQQIKCLGLIRGEAHGPLNATLSDCEAWGMQLEYVARESYRNKTDEEFLLDLKKKYPRYFIVPEGGNNHLGLRGASDIYNHIGEEYDVIGVAVGTATTLRGIAFRALLSQQVLGFSALKNAFQHYEPLQHERIIESYHFGGFGKHSPALLQFMQEFESNFEVELDFVYTAKMMYGMFDLMQKNFFCKGSKVMMVHSGGTQGNRSIQN
jgi:1-aminocyclopropane-1-carboxylate deaminase/D-cysteine desulfhydrase-like pyridoxal-dependent ACC family enzyme